MKSWLTLMRWFFPKYLESEKLSKETTFRYRRLWILAVTLTSVVALAPLITMAVTHIHQTQKTFQSEIRHPISTLVTNAKGSLEFNFEERRAALTYVINDKTFRELSGKEELREVFSNLRKSFGGFIDLGLIDADGLQVSYVGPYEQELHGRNYSDQTWFNKVKLTDFYISEVFMGYRGFPHFVMAVKHEKDGEGFYILRATIDIEFITRQIRSLLLGPAADAFLMNPEGVLQSPSYLYGDIFEQAKLQVPRYSPSSNIIDVTDQNGRPLILGYAFIEESPFIFVVVSRTEELMKNWLALRSNLLGFLAVSIILIILVVFAGNTLMINRIREADIRRAQIFHNMEYTNKMASIGRLAAGVAHEINNPLAIINEKAGLLKDIITTQHLASHQEKFLAVVNSILDSVERCSRVTHGFLGFAKRMDLKIETIEVESLLREVLGFLGKEAIYRNISVNFHMEEHVPDIQSDRGLLQQIFLNIINNAFAAVDDGGTIDLFIKKHSPDHIAVTIADNGTGIPPQQLKHVFEPFYTTKQQGTGLGLSITYSLVEKLGGTISVASTVGAGTSFTVSLPVVKVLTSRNYHEIAEGTHR